MNRFKGPDLVNTVLEELWTEVHNIVQEAANKTIPKKKKSKKAKWLSEETLQIAEEHKEVKSKGERERYIQLNVEFQKIARRNKVFLNEQCLIIQENNKRGKTGDLFRKTGNTMGVFHPKMVTIRDKKGRDLVEGEEIKKRCKEYMEALYKKDLNEPDSYNGVVNHAESDILESEVKWALKSTAVNKASECDEIPAEVFTFLKEDANKVLHSLCQHIWKNQQWP